jgi:hypothetical protein
MFLLDPNGGRRRRALVRDQLVRATRRTRAGLGAAARDITNRSSGIAASARTRWNERRWNDISIDDARVVDRVRAKLGHVSSHPHAIRVEARAGHVTLRGAILDAELERVLSTVAHVRGVASVSNDLHVHDTAEGVRSLQGTGRRPGESFDRTSRRWSPATRALVAASVVASGVVMAAGMAARGSHDWQHQYATR